jgi:hypothetical protein
MRIFKTKVFGKWAAEEGLSDDALRAAVQELEQGLNDGNLGGQVYKKRVGLAGRGKRGGVRTLLAFREGDKAFFMYGFAKNQRENIRAEELKALKLMAKELLGYSPAKLARALLARELVEITKSAITGVKT